MRRFFSLFTMMMLVSVLSFAQSRVVTGKVVDASGKPVPFASVVVRGGGGVQTDANGEYQIRVNPGDVLLISQTSYEEVSIPVGSLSNINTTLKLKDNTIAEVVVTSAFNTKRTARSVASNVQNVSAEQLNTVRAQNVNNAIAGKVAGAQVRSQSAAALGRETAVRLRGENSLTQGGSGALYVVDGTIMPSANDINPDDVEDLTVLQGPAATALFGPDGANGAIVINTKRARKGQQGIGVELNSAIVFDKIYVTPNYQNSYAGGGNGDLQLYTWQPGQPEEWKALDGKYYHDYSDDASWGPRMVGQEYIPWYAWYGGHEGSFKTAALTPQPNNARDFYNTGVTATNNVNFSKAGDAFTLRASYTNLDVKGLIPNSYLKRHTFNANFSIDLGSKWTLGTNFNYINQNSNTENNDGYSNQSTGSFNQWFHRDLDINKMRELRGLRTPEGIYASWNKANPGAYNPANPKSFYGGNYWMNPYSYFDLITNDNQRDRLFGDASITYKFNNDLRLKGTYRKQQLSTTSSTIYPTELEISNNQTSFNPWEGTGLAGYGVSNSFSNRQNYELLATYGKKVRDFQINANAGIDILKTKATGSGQNTMGGINVPGLYSLSNSKNDIAYSQTYQTFTRRGVFARADVGYKNMLFAEGTLREDWTSAEPVGHSIPTHSYGVSFVFSELIKDKSILSYGKIRGSAGKTLLSLVPYELNVLYAPAAQQFNGNFLMTEPGSIPDPNLVGATADEKEIGIETRFLRNRIGFDFTYWDRTNKDFPVGVSVPGASGLSSIRLNAGEVAKKGIEAKLFLEPFRKKNFGWTINANYGQLIRNEVVEIAPGIDRLVVSSGAFSGSSAAYTVSRVGETWGQMFGGGIKRDEATGMPLLTADGFFIKEDNVSFGSVLPKYTGGVQNTFTLFKNFTIAANIDFQSGGKFFSLSDHWGTYSGLTAKTATLNDKGNSIRDAVADGGGVHVFGIDQTTGREVDYYVEAQDYWHQFRGSNISEVFIHDLTFVKLRELSVGYKLPVERMGINKFVKNATFSVIARNPWLIYTKTKDFDPSEVSSVFGEDGQLPGTRSMGFNLRIGF